MSDDDDEIAVASIPGDVWDKQIASREEVWLDFMQLEDTKFETAQALQAEILRLVHKHSITGIVINV